MKHLEVRQKYSAARRIFNSLLSVSSGHETLRLMLDILHGARSCQKNAKLANQLKLSHYLIVFVSFFNYFLQRVKNGMYVKNIVLTLYYYDICVLLSRFLLAAFVQLFNAEAVKGT